MPLYSVIRLGNQPLGWASLTGAYAQDDDARFIDVSRCDKVQAYVFVTPNAASTSFEIQFSSHHSDTNVTAAEYFQNIIPEIYQGASTEYDAYHTIVVAGGVAERKNFIIDTPGDARMIVKAKETGGTTGVLSVYLVGVMLNHS